MAGWWSMHLLVSIRSFSKQFYRKMDSFRWEWFIYDYNVAKHAKAHRGHSIWQIPLVRMDFVLFMPIVNKLQNAGASVRGTLYLTIIIQWQSWFPMEKGLLISSASHFSWYFRRSDWKKKNRSILVFHSRYALSWVLCVYFRLSKRDQLLRISIRFECHCFLSVSWFMN